MSILKHLGERIIRQRQKEPEKQNQDLFKDLRPDWYTINPVGKVPYILNTSDRVISRRIFQTGQFGFRDLRRAAEILDTEFTLVDIGANIGSICIHAVSEGICDHAVAIEPEPLNFRLLKANTVLNDLENQITLINSAAGSEDGQMLSFELSHKNAGDHRVRVTSHDGEYNEQSRDVIKVHSNTLDTLLMNIQYDKALLWIDTQGYEAFVLAGAKQLLAQRPPIVMEFWPYGLHRTGSLDLLIQSLLPYSIYIDLHDETSKHHKISESALHDLATSFGETVKHTDILIF